MDFSKGDKVRLLGRPDWGPGKVLKKSSDGKVHVSFECAGEKLLLLRYAKILKITGTMHQNQKGSTAPNSTLRPESPSV